MRRPRPSRHFTRRAAPPRPSTRMHAPLALACDRSLLAAPRASRVRATTASARAGRAPPHRRRAPPTSTFIYSSSSSSSSSSRAINLSPSTATTRAIVASSRSIARRPAVLARVAARASSDDDRGGGARGGRRSANGFEARGEHRNGDCVLRDRDAVARSSLATDDAKEDAKEDVEKKKKTAVGGTALDDGDVAPARQPRQRAPDHLATTLGAFYTLVPIRPRSRGERRSLRTFAGASLRPPLGFNARPRRLSTPPDAFQLHPDIRLYRTALKHVRRRRRSPPPRRPRLAERRRRRRRRRGLAMARARGDVLGVHGARRHGAWRRARAAAVAAVARDAAVRRQRDASPAAAHGREGERGGGDAGPRTTVSHWFPYDRVGVVNADP